VEQKVDIFDECDMIRARAILIGYSSGSGGGNFFYQGGYANYDGKSAIITTSLPYLISSQSLVYSVEDN
jgi:hypothetical protein